MKAQQEARGTKEEALNNGRELLAYEPAAAAEQAREILAGDPECAEAYRLLGLALRRLGSLKEARSAEDNAIRLATLKPALFEAIVAIAERRLDAAEQLLIPHLRVDPDDAAALRLLAEIGARTGHFDDAESLLKEALQIAPDYERAISLFNAIARAREIVAVGAPDMTSSMALATATGEHGFAEALQLYEQVVERSPEVAENWVSYGNVLRVVGRQDDAIAAFRRAIAIRPSFGQAWWALADLKTRAFDEQDIRQLSTLVDAPEASVTDRAALHFALAMALEHAQQIEDSFRHYSKGNDLRRLTNEHDRSAVTRHVDASIALFTTSFFRDRAIPPYDAPCPIFVLGMPRAGSTLLEQILSSHSKVEGTSELPDIDNLAKALGIGEAGMDTTPYLDQLAAFEVSDLQRFGQSYFWSTGLKRTTNRPFFIDKMPNNWLHLGLILTILPNAKIIDARRHPLACGLSNYKQHFASGQAFSYDLADMGSFYRDYVRMMQHFDELMPGRIHRVTYERVVDETEPEIRRLLDYVGLAFEPQCLRFYENQRTVRTSSSEQVRRPINREGLDQWQLFDPWLGPLKDALGSVLTHYPEVPDDLSSRRR